MNPEVQKIIDQKNKEFELRQAAQKENEKQKVLDKLGMYTIEYSQSNGQPGYSTKEDRDMYPFVEYDANGSVRRYRKVYTEVTDEEFEALKNTAELLPDEKPIPASIDVNGYQCGLAKFMLVLAIVLYLAFFVIGIIMGNNTIASYFSSYSEFSFGTALLYWVIGVFAGTMMLGFAHIVDHLYKQTILLTKINNK